MNAAILADKHGLDCARLLTQMQFLIRRNDDATFFRLNESVVGLGQWAPVRAVTHSQRVAPTTLAERKA